MMKMIGQNKKKRMMALLMTAVMLFSCVYNAASPVPVSEAAETGGSAFKNWSKQRSKTTGINRLLSYGNHIVGKVITGVAGDIDSATGSNGEAGEMASWINTWVLGNSSVSGKLDVISHKLDVIEELCNEILAELDKVEEQLDSIESHLSKQDIAAAKTNMDNAWRRDADMSQISSGSNSVNYEGVGKALDAFVAYMESVKKYKDAQETYGKDSSNANKKNLEKAENNMGEAEEAYQLGILEIYTNGKHLPFNESLQDGMYASYDVNDQIVKVIEGLSEKLCGDGITDTYTDYAAQYAYLTKAFTDEQYDFVTTCMQRQLLQICNLEIMYQDFLSRQNEYISENYGDDEKTWDGFGSALGILAKVNDRFSKAAAERMEKEIRFNPSSENTIHLYTYVTAADTVLYEDDRDGVKGIPPVLQKGVLHDDGTVSVFWFTKNTQESDEYDDNTNKTLRSMRNYEKELIYTGIDKEAKNNLTAGDLIFLRLMDLYPEDLSSYEKAENSVTDKDYVVDPKNGELSDLAEKLQEIHGNDAYNCGEGKNWKKWLPKLFTANIYSADSQTPKSYLSKYLVADKELPSLTTDPKTDKTINRTFVYQSVVHEYDHLLQIYDPEYDHFMRSYVYFVDLDEKIEDALDNVEKVRAENYYLGRNSSDEHHDPDASYWEKNHPRTNQGEINFDEEDNLDIYCANYSGQYKQNIQVKNSDSVKINGKAENTQALANGTVKLSFEKEVGGKAAVALMFHHTNALGDNASEKFDQDGEVVVDCDEMQSLLAMDPDADTVEMEIPVRYANNAAYEVIYDDSVGDVKNPDFSTDESMYKLTVSFDRIDNATKAKIVFSSDEKFENVIKTDTLDLKKDYANQDRISKAYNINLNSYKNVYVYIVGYAEWEYGTMYGNELSTRVLAPPRILQAAMVTADGDVSIRLDRISSEYSTQVQFSPAEDNFKNEDTIVTKTIKGWDAIFRLELGKHYYVRARQISEDSNGESVHGCWSDTYTELYTEIRFDNIDKVEVLDPHTVRITASKTPEKATDGFRYVAYTENVPLDTIKDYFSKESPKIDGKYRDDIKYMEVSLDEVNSTENLAQTFSDLKSAKWYFFVEIYAIDENGQKKYSNKKEDKIDVATVDLGKSVGISEIKATAEDEITVSHTDDYTSTYWMIQVIDTLDGGKVYDQGVASVNDATMTLKIPRKNKVEVRISCWWENPDTGEEIDGLYETSSGYQTYESRFVDLSIIKDFNIYDGKTFYVTLGSMDGYPSFSGYYYELYRDDEKIYELKTKEKSLHINETFKEGRYRIEVRPYVKKSDGTYNYFIGSEVSLTFRSPELEGVILLPHGSDESYLTIIVSTGEPGDALPEDVYISVTQQDEDGHASELGGDATYDEEGYVWTKKFNVDPSRYVSLTVEMQSRWDKKTTESIRNPTTYYSVTTKMLEVVNISYDSLPSYSSFSDWLDDHANGMIVDFDEEPIPTPTPVPTKKPTPRPGRSFEIGNSSSVKKSTSDTQKTSGTSAAGDTSGKKTYRMTVSMPESMEDADGNTLEFDGINVRLTSDKDGKKVIATGYEEGRQLVITKLSEENGIKEGKSCYIWISPFNYGDAEKKVVLNAGYVGPYRLTVSTSNVGSPKPVPDTNVTTKSPDVPNTGTKKTNAGSTGISVGKKATAGSGTSKAVYKATGKNTVTYVKYKAKKSATKATVPATVKIKGKKYKVTKIAKGAFKGYKKLKTVTVKAQGLTKKKVTGCFKGTSVKNVRVPKKLYKKYKKIFTKKITMSKVKIGVKK